MSAKKKTKRIDLSEQNLKDTESHLHNVYLTLKQAHNPDELLPDTTRFKFFKKNLLRILKVYTEHQVRFNQHIYEAFSISHNLLVNILHQLSAFEKTVADLKKHWDHDRKKLLTDYFKDIDPLLQHKFTQLRKAIREKDSDSQKSLYFDQFADDYYVFQQEKFRGSFEAIKERQQKYIPQIKSVRTLAKKYPFVDIGFGRGEFMEILREQGIEKIIGADTNPHYVKRAKKEGYGAALEDGVQFLENYKGKLSGVSAFHVAEHMPFPALFDLIYLTHMKLAEGGIAIFETPNIENVLISSHSFYIDHTHITKLSPTFFKALFEFFKFKKIDILYNLPIKEERNTDTERVLFGPQDYAIVAYK